MARIAGVDVPREKRVEIGLTYIYGIGPTTSRHILQKTQINPDTRVRDLTEDEVQRVREVIDHEYRVEGDLRREVALNIKRLTEIGSYRGLRHRRNLSGTRTTDKNQCPNEAWSTQDGRWSPQGNVEEIVYLRDHRSRSAKQAESRRQRDIWEEQHRSGRSVAAGENERSFPAGTLTFTPHSTTRL